MYIIIVLAIFAIIFIASIYIYSNINRKEKGVQIIERRAKEDFKKHILVTNKKYGENLVKIWRYDPQILVDKHFLYLSLKGTDDEHIQIELENKINNIEW